MYLCYLKTGDSASLPTSKTAAAISSQAPVLVSNLVHEMKHEPLTAKYNGLHSPNPPWLSKSSSSNPNPLGVVLWPQPLLPPSLPSSPARFSPPSPIPQPRLAHFCVCDQAWLWVCVCMYVCMRRILELPDLCWRQEAGVGWVPLWRCSWRDVPVGPKSAWSSRLPHGIHTHTHTHTHTRLPLGITYVYIHLYIHMYIYLYMHAYAYAYAYMIWCFCCVWHV